MNSRTLAALLAATALAVATATAHAQTNVRIRGTITGKPRGWDGLTMIGVEPGPVGRYCLCRC